MNLYVTRHGQTDWNIQKKVMGRVDEPLNSKGIEQAKEIHKKLMNTEIDIIICSPLLRARQTAEEINKGRNIPIIYDDRIIERDFGEFEGKERKEFDFEGFWNYYKNDKCESAENIHDLFKRIYEFLDSIIAEYTDKNVLIVCHGGVSIPIACYFNNSIPTGSLVELGLGNCEVVNYKTNQLSRKIE